MRAHARTIIVIAAIGVVLVGAGYVAFQYYSAQKALAFFTAAAQGISENVTVSGTTYLVQNGVVTEQNGAEPSQSERLAALRLAYAVTLARRDPLFDLAGVPLGSFRTSINDLAQAQKEMEQLQASSTNAQLIANLDPISFLNALANLEQARETFIASGTDTDERAYEAALNAAVTAGTADIKNFKASYDEVGHPTYTLVAGIVQGSSIDAELQNIENGYASVGAQAKARSACIAGDVWDCNANNIALQSLQTTAATSTPALPPIVQQVQQIYSATGYKGAETYIVNIPSSPCTDNLGAPAYFEIFPAYPANILFMGDMYFTYVGGTQYTGLFQNLGVSYLLYNPITYYTCLENGYIFAQAHDAVYIAVTLDGSSTPQDLVASSVTAQLESLLQNSTPDQQKQLLDMYLMVKDNSGAFPSIIENIAQTEEVDVAQKEAGVPTDLDPSFLYSAKSGFYDLFMAYNPSFGSTPINLYTNAATNPILSSLVAWSGLRSSVSPQKIESDLEAYAAYHLKPLSVVSALPSASSTPQAPAGMNTYQNNAYGFTLFYPNSLTEKEIPGSDDTMSVVFQDAASDEGFQIYIEPYSAPQITQQRFEEDEPSGVMNSPTNITVDGAAATQFYSTDTAMGNTVEIWFLHGGYLYEVTAPQAQQSWLLQIMETWQFN